MILPLVSNIPLATGVEQKDGFRNVSSAAVNVECVPDSILWLVLKERERGLV